MGIATSLNQDACMGRVSQITGHESGHATKESESPRPHPRMTNRYQRFHSALIRLAYLVNYADASLRTGPIGMSRAGYLLPQHFPLLECLGQIERINLLRRRSMQLHPDLSRGNGQQANE